jgi:hypothetical protein
MKRKAVFIMEIDDFQKDATKKDWIKEFKIEEEAYNFGRLTNQSRIIFQRILEEKEVT